MALLFLDIEVFEKCFSLILRFLQHCWRGKQGKCTTQAKVLELDRRHMEILGIKIGEILTWSKAVKRIRKKMSLEKFDYACEECNWQPYGMCRSALLTHSK